MDAFSNHEDEAFSFIIRSSKPIDDKHPMKSRFVKRVEVIHMLDIFSTLVEIKASVLHQLLLIAKFTCVWPNLQASHIWLSKHWDIVSNHISSYYCGSGYYLFLISNKEERY